MTESASLAWKQHDPWIPQKVIYVYLFEILLLTMSSTGCLRISEYFNTHKILSLMQQFRMINSNRM
jgi:hypothetical protein